MEETFPKKCPEQKQKKPTECSKSFFFGKRYVCIGKSDQKWLHTPKVFICPSACAKNYYICRETYVAETIYKGIFALISMFAALWIFQISLWLSPFVSSVDCVSGIYKGSDCVVGFNWKSHASYVNLTWIKEKIWPVVNKKFHLCLHIDNFCIAFLITSFDPIYHLEHTRLNLKTEEGFQFTAVHFYGIWVWLL